MLKSASGPIYTWLACGIPSAGRARHAMTLRGQARCEGSRTQRQPHCKGNRTAKATAGVGAWWAWEFGAQHSFEAQDKAAPLQTKTRLFAGRRGRNGISGRARRHTAPTTESQEQSWSSDARKLASLARRLKHLRLNLKSNC